MSLSREEFCKEFKLTENQFFGRDVIDGDFDSEYLEYLPEGISLKCNGFVYINSIKELPKNTFLESLDGTIEAMCLKELSEGCSLKGTSNIYLPNLERISEGCTLKSHSLHVPSLKYLPENYLIETDKVYCNIILPTYKGSSEFCFGYHFWHKKRSFKDYQHIKESPLKYVKSDDPLIYALVRYYLTTSS